jgi:hypothetical protein
MDYPKYKNKKIRYYGKWLMAFVIANYLLSLFFPWYTYIHGSFLFLVMAYHILKHYRGFKAFSGIVFSVLVMLLVFDFKDFDFTWSLDYVFPSVMIFLSVILLIMIFIRKHSWKKHYDLHFYILMLNILMIVLLFFGIIQSNVLIIVTYSIILMSVIIIRLKVGKHYKKDIDKFTHY